MGSLFKKPKAPKQPPPTAQELALGRRQDDALSREIKEENRRKKDLLRGTLGRASLLTDLGGVASGGAAGTFTGTTFAGATTPSKPGAKSTIKSIIGPRRKSFLPDDFSVGDVGL